MTLRAPLSDDIRAFEPVLERILPLLALPDGSDGRYASIFLERRVSQQYHANFKQTQLANQATLGAVLRIYDGYTLFEEASDDLEEANLKRLAQEFSARVKSSTPPAGTPRHPYTPPSWGQRLATSLEADFTDQVPADRSPDQWVHFGNRMVNDPSLTSAAQILAGLRATLDTCKRLAPSHGLSEADLTFATARQVILHEESLFIDREVKLSQSLYRIMGAVIAMSGAERAYHRFGGLGGLETVQVDEEQINGLLGELAGLKKAEPLKPGKYRVLFSPVLSGVLAHEAFGHAQEGDTCARGRSKAWELHKSGTVVGNDQATILNNPAIYDNGVESYGAWGSYFFDEEGWFAQEQVLLDRGVLKAPMTNLTSAIRLGVPRSANGKRESWANGVYTRQTNTYFSAGDKTLVELYELLGDGFVALHPAGGMEDPKGMGIQVGISFLQEVKGGRLTGRVFRGPVGGDIQMTGYTPDILNSIVAKSKIEFDSRESDAYRHPFNGVGGCGKYHKEIVNAGCGGPYLLLDQVILG